MVLCLTICSRQAEKMTENKVTDWIKTRARELEYESKEKALFSLVNIFWKESVKRDTDFTLSEANVPSHSATRSRKSVLMERICKMSYERKWKVLAEMLTKLQERGKKIPVDVLNDLRSAKTMIQVLKADPTHIESISRIDTYLRTVEAYTIFTMEKQGKGNVEEWLKKLKELESWETNEKEAKNSTFVTSVPRNKNWMRIQISEDIPREEMKKRAEENGLSYKLEENGYILVHGDKKNIKMLVNRLAEHFRDARNG